MEPEELNNPQLQQQPQQPEMNPLGESAQEIDPLSAMGTPQTFRTEDDEANNRRSAMYSVGKLDESPLQGDIFDTYAATRSVMLDSIRELGDNQFRQEAEIKAMNSEVNSLSLMAANAYNPQEAQGAYNALQATLIEKANQKAQDAAERAFVERITDLRDEGETSQAELEIMQKNTPDVFDHMIDMQTIRASIMRHIEDANVEVKDRNPVLWLTDMLMYIYPFAHAMTATDNYEVEPHYVKTGIDMILSGNRLQSEANNAWRHMLNTRNRDDIEKITKAWANGVAKNVGTILGPNELMRAERLMQLGVTPPAWETNIGDALDNMPTIGGIGMKMFKTPFRISNALRASGANRAVVDFTEKFLELADEVGFEEAERRMGTTVDEITDNTLVSALDPETAVTPTESAQFTVKVGDTADVKRINDLFKREQELTRVQKELIVEQEIARARLKAGRGDAKGTATVEQRIIDSHQKQIDALDVEINAVRAQRGVSENAGARLGEARQGQRDVFEEGDLNPRPGDEIQWSPDAGDQFTTPRKVTQVSDDGKFVFVEGSGAGIPVEETIVINRAAKAGEASAATAPVAAAAPSDADMFTAAVATATAKRTAEIVKRFKVMQKEIADLKKGIDEATDAEQFGQLEDELSFLNVEQKALQEELDALKKLSADMEAANAPPKPPKPPKPPGPPLTPPKPTPVTVVDRIKEGMKIFEEWVGPLQQVERLNEAEKVAIQADLMERAKRIAVSGKRSKRHVADMQWVTKPQATGTEIHEVYATLGAVESTDSPIWFKSFKRADDLRKATGIEGAHVIDTVTGAIITSADEVTELMQLGVRARLPVDETGRSLAGARHYMSMADKEKAGVLWPLHKYLSGGALQGSDELHGLAQISHDKRNKINAAVQKNVVPKFYALNSEEKEVLRTTLAAGERAGVWYSPDEVEAIHRINFSNKSDPKKFMEAYQAAVDITNVRYFLHASAILANYTSQGYEKVFFSGLKNLEGVVGQVIRRMGKVPPEAVWDVEKGNQTGYGARVQPVDDGVRRPRYDLSRLSTEDLKDKFDNGYVIVRTQQPQKMVDGSKIRYFLVKGDQLQVSQLMPEDVLPYKAGGSRGYEAPIWIKKATTGKQPWGQQYLDAPFVPTNALTKAEGVQWAASANRIQKIADDLMSAETKVPEADIIKAIDEAIVAEKALHEGKLSFPTAEEFFAWMEEHGSKHPFEAVGDRELPSFYSSGGKLSGEETWLEELSGMSTFMPSQGKMFTSPKGPMLPNIRDWTMDAQLIDPFTMLNDSLEQIAKLSSLNDFRIKGVQKWVSTYGPYLDLQGVENMNPMRIFLEGKFRSDTPDIQARKGAAEVQRSYIKRQLGWQSDFDIALQSGTRKFMDSLAGDDIGFKSKFITGAYNYIDEAKPINGMMGLAMDATMGFLNIAQWPLQVMTAIGASAIDLTKGGQAMANLIPLFWWRAQKNKLKAVNGIIKMGWHKVVGFNDPNEYRQMMMALDRVGFMDNVLATMKETYGARTAMGVIGKSWQSVSKGGRIFVNNAEQINRSVAWQMAWRLIKEDKKFAGLVVNSPQFIERVRKLAGTLSANMDEAGAAAWQKNTITKVPTQFMSYMARWHEMLFDKYLTPVQKARFFTGQAFFFGTAGIPFAAWMADMYQRNQGEVPEPGTLGFALDRGFIDTMLFYSTGMNWDMSSKAGIGAYPTDLIMELFGHGRYGEVSAAEIVGGASGQIWSQFADAGFATLYYAAKESGGESGKPLTEATIKRAARSISLLNNVLKAEAIWNYGQYTNRKGEVIIGDIPSQYAFAALLGIPPGEFQKQTAEMGWLADRTAAADKWSEQIMIFRQQYGNAITRGDYMEADQIGDDINFIIRYVMPRDIVVRAKEKAFQDPRTREVSESIHKRWIHEKSQKELIERNAR